MGDRRANEVDLQARHLASLSIQIKITIIQNSLSTERMSFMRPGAASHAAKQRPF
jgi:hypothetical protein